MRLYRTKPVEILAWQLTVENVNDIAIWSKGEAIAGDSADTAYIIIHTLEGDMRAIIGDFVIKGLKGEFYPCKSEIFNMKYELVK